MVVAKADIIELKLVGKKENREAWQKNQTKNAKATGKAYISQRTGKLQKAKEVCVSKILWYIINL